MVVGSDAGNAHSLALAAGPDKRALAAAMIQRKYKQHRASRIEVNQPKTEIIFSGWLEKKASGGSLTAHWQNRWFVLNLADRALTYYKHKESAYPMGWIALQNIMRCAKLPDSKGRRFEVFLSHKVYHLRVKQFEERTCDIWVAHIQKAKATIGKRIEAFQLNMPVGETHEETLARHRRNKTPDLPEHMRGEWQLDAGDQALAEQTTFSEITIGFLRTTLALQSGGLNSNIHALIAQYPTENHMLNMCHHIVINTDEASQPAPRALSRSGSRYYSRRSSLGSRSRGSSRVASPYSRATAAPDHATSPTLEPMPGSRKRASSLAEHTFTDIQGRSPTSPPGSIPSNDVPAPPAAPYDSEAEGRDSTATVGRDSTMAVVPDAKPDAPDAPPGNNISETKTNGKATSRVEQSILTLDEHCRGRAISAPTRAISASSSRRGSASSRRPSDVARAPPSHNRAFSAVSKGSPRASISEHVRLRRHSVGSVVGQNLAAIVPTASLHEFKTLDDERSTAYKLLQLVTERTGIKLDKNLSVQERLMAYLTSDGWVDTFVREDFLTKDMVIPLIFAVLQFRHHQQKVSAPDSPQASPDASERRKVQLVKEKAELDEHIDTHDDEEAGRPDVAHLIQHFFKERSSRDKQGMRTWNNSLPPQLHTVFQKHVSTRARRSSVGHKIAMLDDKNHWHQHYHTSCSSCQKTQVQFYQVLQKMFHNLALFELSVSWVCMRALTAMLVTPVEAFHLIGSDIDIRDETTCSYFNKPVVNAGVWKAILVILAYSNYHVRHRILKDLLGVLQHPDSRDSLLALPGWQRHLFAIIHGLEDVEDPACKRIFQYTMLMFSILHLHLLKANQSSGHADFPTVLLHNLQIALGSSTPTNMRVPRTMLTTLVNELSNENSHTLQGRWDWMLFLLNLVFEFLFTVPVSQDTSSKLFAGLDDIEPSKLRKAEKIGTPIQLEENQVVFEAGDHGSQMYIVRQGSCQAFKRQQEGTNLVLAEWHAGQFFGEKSLLLGLEAPRNATVKASSPNTQLLQLDTSNYKSFFKLLGSKTKNHIYGTMKNRLVQNFRTHNDSILSSEIVSSLQMYNQIADLCEIETFQPGQTVFNEGDEADKFYIVVIGTVEVLLKEEGAHVKTVTLVPGGSFGEMGVKDDRVRQRTASVQAAVGGRTVVLLSMNLDNFRKFLELAPAALAKLRSKYANYQLSVKWTNFLKIGRHKSKKTLANSSSSNRGSSIGSLFRDKKETFFDTLRSIRVAQGLHWQEKDGIDLDADLVESVVSLLRTLHMFKEIDATNVAPENLAVLRKEIESLKAGAHDVYLHKAKEEFELYFGSLSKDDRVCIELIQKRFVPIFREAPVFLYLVNNRMFYLMRNRVLARQKIVALVDGFVNDPTNRTKLFGKLNTRAQRATTPVLHQAQEVHHQLEAIYITPPPQ